MATARQSDVYVYRQLITRHYLCVVNRGDTAIGVCVERGVLVRVRSSNRPRQFNKLTENR